jgi:hypothetical protein
VGSCQELMSVHTGLQCQGWSQGWSLDLACPKKPCVEGWVPSQSVV